MCETGIDWGIIVGAFATLAGTFWGSRLNTSAKNDEQKERNATIKSALIPIADSIMAMRRESINKELRLEHLEYSLQNGHSLVLLSDDKNLAVEFYKLSGILRTHFALGKDPEVTQGLIDEFKSLLTK